MKATAILILLGFGVLAGCAGGGPFQQGVQEHVVLNGALGNTGCLHGSAGHTFRRVFPDGTGALQPFKMPPDKSLVITDLDWYYSHPQGAATAGRRVVLRIFVQNLADPERSERVMESILLLNGEGEAGVNNTMTTGFVVAPTAQICIDTMGAPKGPPSGVQHMILRGYFIDAS